MGKTTRYLFCLLAFLMGAPAFSQSCFEYNVTIFSPDGGPRATSKSAACTAECAVGGLPVSSASNDELCQCNGPGSNPLGGYNVYPVACPNPDQCGLAPGSKLKSNFGEGWARSGELNKLDHVGKLTLPFFVGGGETGTQLQGHCIDKCRAIPKRRLDNYRSKVPSPNGFYRLSADYEYEVIGTSASGATGDTCSTATNTQEFQDAVSPNTAPLPCPGTVGEVNGKTICIPGNTPSTSIPPPLGEVPAGNEQSGNPRAGEVPSTGEGSGTGGAGRTPTAGTGTHAGGPSAAASSAGNPTGTTPKPADGQEQAECGAPGQPPCRIDETGTPTQGNFSDGEQRLEQAKTDAIAEINKARTGQGFTWSFQLPTGCQPLQLPAFAGMIDSIDICQFQPMIHDLLSMIWIAATIFALWGMASRAFASE